MHLTLIQQTFLCNFSPKKKLYVIIYWGHTRNHKSNHANKHYTNVENDKTSNQLPKCG